MALGAIGGFKKGFILEIITLLALILAVIGGFHFLHWGMSVLTDNFQLSGKFLPFLAFLLIFVGIVALVNAIGQVLKKVVHMAFLGGVDRIAGALLGAVKFVFFFSVLIWAFQIFGVELPQHLQDDSFFYTYIVAIAPATVDLFGFIIPASSELMDEISDLLNFSTP
ncbi:MAG: CvpA family protein [Bacteroidetes bacterium]|nr:MAG: CvpA family protein [Bacteroidota bacterium]